MMKSSILRPVAAGVTLAILIFFMPFLLAGAMITLLFGFIAFRFFFRRMRREFAGRTRFRSVDPLRSHKYRSGHEDGNQVIYLSPDQYR